MNPACSVLLPFVFILFLSLTNTATLILPATTETLAITAPAEDTKLCDPMPACAEDAFGLVKLSSALKEVSTTPCWKQICFPHSHSFLRPSVLHTQLPQVRMAGQATQLATSYVKSE